MTPLVLADNQNTDGSWGSESNHILLTSMATLAFLSRGETTTSKEYGQAIEKALRLLVREAELLDVHPAKNRAKAALTWILAEAYDITRHKPLQAALTRTPRLTSDDPVPWRVLAAKALFVSQADTNFTKKAFLDLCPPVDFDATNGFDRTVASLICREIGLWQEAQRLSPPLESTNDWKRSEEPFMHAYLLQAAFFDKGGPSYVQWNKTFYPEIVNAQLVRQDRGWWTPEALGLGPNKETAGMTKNDAAIYATTWMILCEPPTRRLPVYKPNNTTMKPVENADDVKIEIL